VDITVITDIADITDITDITDIVGEPDITDSGSESQIPLRELLPDTETLFGQPIDEIPSPIAEVGDRTFSWSYEITDEQLSSAVYEAPESHKLVWERYSSLIPHQYRESLLNVTFLYSLDTIGLCDGSSAFITADGFGRTEPGGERSQLVICESLAATYFNAAPPSVDTIGEHLLSIYTVRCGLVLQATSSDGHRLLI